MSEPASESAIDSFDDILFITRENKSGIQHKKCPPKHLSTPLSKELKNVLSSTSTVLTPTNDSRNTLKSSNNKTPTVLKTNRRRPQTGVRALTSSDVAEKYNILLDRRLVLIEKQIEQANETKNFLREEQKQKISLFKTQDENLSLEKEEKQMKIELLKLEVAHKRSLLTKNV